MPAERLPMRHLRELLRLYHAGLPQHVIGDLGGRSRGEAGAQEGLGGGAVVGGEHWKGRQVGQLGGAQTRDAEGRRVVEQHHASHG